MMIYIVIVHWYARCGDEDNSGDVITGVYSTEEKAEERGKQYLLENYAYDKESDVFYGPGCDEATACVIEFELDKDADVGL